MVEEKQGVIGQGQLPPQVEQLAKDMIQASRVATDFLCYMQETGVHKNLPEKDDTEGMKKFLQDFFDYMANRVKRTLKKHTVED